MSGGIPLRKRLLVRLVATSVLIAMLSVAATAWLAVQTTTHALQAEQGQALADDAEILRDLSGYAATHPNWSGVTGAVRDLSVRLRRRIALTTPDGALVVDSARRGTSLPAQSVATVDPLRTDTYSEPGAQLSAVDPRAVGPYRLSPAERAHLHTLVVARQRCFQADNIHTSVVLAPSGRPFLVQPGGTPPDPFVAADECPGTALGTPTATERKALDGLETLARSCLARRHLAPSLLLFSLGFVPTSVQPIQVPGQFTPPGPATAERHAAIDCVNEARREQLAPFVAPAAELFLGNGSSTSTSFDMSSANKTKVAAVTALVFALTVAVTAVVATRLVRPLRALTHAAQQPPDRHARVPVTTRDETGILAEAFNALSEGRERLEAQRKQMVSDIAHELRTPLTNIRGWLEVTRDGLVDPDPELLASLHEEALVLQRVIDDLQDLAAADAGTLQLHCEPVRADELLAQVASAHRIAADTAGVRLVTTSDGCPWLDADPVRMRQALGNLVSNAIRHTPAGGTITLSADVDGDHVVFEVADTGSGIDPRDLPHVFDRFWRAEKSRSRRTGGSGLGLSIVRQLTAAHGGTVSVTSEPGTGSVFTLRIPATQPGSATMS
ncbi:sensor histidine kinase [Streptacidiphilus jiangxiensis]|uniref:histidine kinase n=1 Tax=Streptacidiphilus jiangxiensis TaxID=235985 RepID=A0A1H7HZ54_STRJI|nr:HAMP domain-containing sensor histidine kinase [Streptacidiphilus jiangxiensis]SEK55633.1 two-component system, OmpR family, sensor histidine kinase BaeS [Streptacidiphilus jiangxiensis]